jgi:histidine phosphotransferase ChpT
MTTPEMLSPDRALVALEPLELAALLCSRVCHDVIGPVGAIANGLEVLDEDSDPSMREIALDLIKKSAFSASARLQFCRLAFGAAGSKGASIDTGDAETVARGLLGTEKTTLAWRAQRQFVAKNTVKLLLNLCVIAGATIPRGGVIGVDLLGEGDNVVLIVTSKGANPRLAAGVADLVAGKPETGKVDAHTIQPYYTGLVARECGMRVDIEASSEGFTFAAKPIGLSDAGGALEGAAQVQA